MRKIVGVILAVALGFSMAGVSVAKPTTKPTPKSTAQKPKETKVTDCNNPKTRDEALQCYNDAQNKANQSSSEASSASSEASSASSEARRTNARDDENRGAGSSSSSESSSSSARPRADATTNNHTKKLAETHGFKGNAKVSDHHDLIDVAAVLKSIQKAMGKAA